jgi:4-aminobutyrate aminotransferase
MGRSGRPWAAQHSGVVPDVLLSAKGLASGMPLGAIIAKTAIMTWPKGSHGSTFGGNPVSCAAALATLDIVEREGIANAARMGERLLDGLARLQQEHVLIGDVRGRGLFIGVELVRDRPSKQPAPAETSELVQRAFRKGLLLLPCGQSVVRMCPSLLIDEQDVAASLAILDDCLTSIEVEP